MTAAATRPGLLGLAALALLAAPLAAADPAPDDPYGEPVRYGGRSQRLQAPSAWWAVAASPDGKLLVTTHGDGGGNGGEAWVWDRAAGKVVRTLREPGGVRTAVFSPDGKVLVTGNFDNAIRCYDTATWELWASAYDTTGGHSGGVNGLAVTPDGRWLASAGLDRTARLWDFDAVRKARVRGAPTRFGPRAVFTGHTAGVFSVALTADGKTLLTGSGDKTARIWDVPANLPGSAANKATVDKPRAVLEGHTQAVEAVAISPDGKTFATGSWDMHVRLWDPDGKLRETVGPYEANVLALAFDKSGRQLAVGTGSPGNNANPGNVHVLTAADGWQTPPETKPLSAKPHAGPVYSVAWLPDGKTVASAGRDRTLRLRTVGNDGDGVTLRNDLFDMPADQTLLAAALSPDGKLLAVGGENKAALVWDVGEKRVVHVLGGHADVVSAVAWSADGKRIATASHDKTVKLWDAQTGKELRTLKGHTNWVFAVAFGPDGRTLASGGYDRTVRLWDAGTGEPRATWREHTAAVRSLAFADGGRSLVSAGSDRIIRVWDVARGEVTASLKGHKAAVRAVAVSPDGRTVASAGEDKRVRLWDVATGQEKVRAVETPDLATAVRFSPKGHVLLAGTYNGQVLNVNPATGAVRGTFNAGGPQQAPDQQANAIVALLFAPDGRQVVSVSQDKNVLLWKPAEPPAPARVVFRHGEAVVAAALSRDGKLFATAGKSGAVQVWDAEAGKELRELPRHPGAVTSLLFLGGSHRLLAAGADGVRVVNAETGEPGSALSPGVGVTRAAANPDGKLVAVALAGKPDVLVYDLAAGGEPRKLAGHTEAVKALAFDPSGTRLLTGGTDGQIVEWDAAAGKEVRRYPAKPTRTWVDHLAFSPDGQTALAVLNYPGSAGGDDAEAEQPVHEVVFFNPAAGPPQEQPQARRQQPVFYAGGTVADAVFGPRGSQAFIATENGRVVVWDVAAKRQARSFDAHLEAVTAVAVGAGNAVFTAGDDHLAKRWDTPSPMNFFVQARLFTGNQVWASSFSADGKLLATAGSDATVRLRTAVPGEGVTTVQGAYPCAFSVALSPDETLLASGHLGGVVRLTDLRTGRKVREFADLPHRAWTVAFSPDGKTLAAVGGDWQEGKPGWLKVWAVADGKELFSAEHPETAFGVTFSTDGKQIATGCRDGKVRVWNTATWEAVRTMDHAGPVRTVTRTPDGQAFVSGGNDGRVVFWDAQTGKLASEFKVAENGRVSRVAFAPDQKTFAVSYNERAGENEAENGRVQVRELGAAEPKRTITDFGGMVLDVAFSPDGVTLAAAGGRHGQFAEFRFFEVKTGAKIAASPGHKHWIESIAFSKDGSKIVSAGGVAEEPGEIRVRSARGLLARTAMKGSWGVMTAAFSPDGSLVAAGRGNGAVDVYDVAKALARGGAAADESAVRFRLKGGPTGVRRVLFSRDGRRLFASCEDGTVRAWDAETGREVKTLKAHDLPVYGLALSPDGKTFATSAGDWKARTHGEVKLWDADTLAPIGELPRQEAPIWSVAFAKDGKTLFAAGAGLFVYDLPTRTLRRRAAQAMPIRSIAVSPDGRFLAAGHQTQGQVKVFDTTTLQEQATLGQHQNLIFDVSFSPDSRLLASSSGDGSTIVWRNQTVQAEQERAAGAKKMTPKK